MVDEKKINQTNYQCRSILQAAFFSDILSPKKYRAKTVSREKLQKTLSCEKGAHKILVKLTPGSEKVAVFISSMSTGVGSSSSEVTLRPDKKIRKNHKNKGHSRRGEGQCHQGPISSTYLQAAFTPVAPKSVRIKSSCQYLFTLLGSLCVKAVRRTLMKLTPDVRGGRRLAKVSRNTFSKF